MLSVAFVRCWTSGMCDTGLDGAQPRLRPFVHGDYRQRRPSYRWLRPQRVKDVDLECACSGSLSGLGEMRLGWQDSRVFGRDR
jgi:hypothetical protein